MVSSYESMEDRVGEEVVESLELIMGKMEQLQALWAALKKPIVVRFLHHFVLELLRQAKNVAAGEDMGELEMAWLVVLGRDLGDDSVIMERLAKLEQVVLAAL